ncbi:F-actin capping protein [Trypanosoma rangeli]|uniref:F-actin capping protein n=1 Tax=Trypanosoma rangeli TaxID=5698 RepID=A0A422NQJ3_TRYRA|nr:F-actin capping protein [Trypanosoma rangeli]RNF07777.1 F-actin capping protein [Trypanosoma rangeli]|eukprot:RNF07777.1 F-actin capping protein [Trypanosoma rangeli]
MPACDAAVRKAMDSLDILRRFILAAPPGELQNVLKALRVVTGDDHFFFEVIPRLCMEYHMRHLTPFTMPAVSVERHEIKVQFTDPNNVTVTSSNLSFLAGRQNHLGSRIKHFAKIHCLHARNVAQDVEEYFRQQCSTFIPRNDNINKKSGQDMEVGERDSGASDNRHSQTPQRRGEVLVDPFDDIVPYKGFDELSHVFFDAALQMYIEVDPVSQISLRVIPFTLDVASTMPEVLREIEKQATNIHSGPLGYTRFLLQQEVARYVQACFGEDVATGAATQAEQSALGTRERSHPMGPARTLVDIHRTAAACAGSMAVLQPHSYGGGEDCLSVVIAVAAVRQFPRNMWSGRWKSIFVIECTTNLSSEEEWVCIKGETQVYAHYYEDGNMHLEVVEELPPTPLPEWPVNIFAVGGDIVGSADTWKLCSAVMAVIQQHEQRIHDAVLRTARDSGDRALQTLRRRLPITRQLFNFCRGQPLPRPMFTRPGCDD